MNEPRVDQISLELTELIVAGGLKPNARLPTERELADRYQTTRASVRKALDMLQRDGRIVRNVGRGTFVAPTVQPFFPDTALRDVSPADLSVARALIEPSVAEHAALHASASELDEIERSMLNCEKAADIREFDFWDGKLHEAIASSAHNAFVELVYGAILQVRQSAEWNKVKIFAVTPERRKKTEADHRRIVEAIKDRNGRLARDAMRDHLEHIGQYISQRD